MSKMRRWTCRSVHVCDADDCFNRLYGGGDFAIPTSSTASTEVTCAVREVATKSLHDGMIRIWCRFMQLSEYLEKIDSSRTRGWNSDPSREVPKRIRIARSKRSMAHGWRFVSLDDGRTRFGQIDRDRVPLADSRRRVEHGRRHHFAIGARWTTRRDRRAIRGCFESEPVTRRLLRSRAHGAASSLTASRSRSVHPFPCTDRQVSQDWKFRGIEGDLFRLRYKIVVFVLRHRAVD